MTTDTNRLIALREAVRLNACSLSTARVACLLFNERTGARMCVDRASEERGATRLIVTDLNDLPRPWDMTGTPTEITAWFLDW